MKTFCKVFLILFFVTYLSMSECTADDGVTSPLPGLSYREILKRIDTGLKDLNEKSPKARRYIVDYEWNPSGLEPGEGCYIWIEYGSLTERTSSVWVEIHYGFVPLPDYTKMNKVKQTSIRLYLLFTEGKKFSKDSIAAYRDLSKLLGDVCLPDLQQELYLDYMNEVIQNFQKGKASSGLHDKNVESGPGALSWYVGSSKGVNGPGTWQFTTGISIDDAIYGSNDESRYIVDENKRPKSFMGVVWGEDISNLDLVPAEGFVESYVKKGASPKVFGVDTESVVYIFANGKFCWGQITLDPKENLEKVIQGLKDTLGDLPPRFPDAYEWAFEDVLVNYDAASEADKVRIHYMNIPIFEEKFKKK